MKYLFLTICFLSYSVSSFSQTTLGFKIGANFDYIEFRNDDKSVEKLPPAKFIGGHFGLAVDIPIYEDIISFSPELQFSAKTGIDLNSADSTTTWVRGDVQIPLLFTCYILPDFGVSLGPSIHILVVEGFKTGDEWDDYESPIEERLDFGIEAGARLRVTDGLTIFGRYYYGLRNTFANFTPAIPIKVYNRAIQIGIIYSGSGRDY